MKNKSLLSVLILPSVFLLLGFTSFPSPTESEFSYTKSISTKDPIVDFKLNSKGEIEIIVTSKKILFLKNDQKLKSLNSADQVLLSRTSKHVANCEVISIDAHHDVPRPSRCDLYSDTGDTINTSRVYVSLNPKLIGTKMFSGSNIVDLKSGQEIRNYRGTQYSYFLMGDSYNYSILSVDDIYPMPLKLINNSNGKVISEGKFNLTPEGISSDGEILHGEVLNGELTIRNQSFKPIHTWNKVKSKGHSVGHYLEGKNLLAIPTWKEHLFVGNYETGDTELINYPITSFKYFYQKEDPRNNLIFYYGGAQFEKKNTVKKRHYVLVFKGNDATFSDTFLEFEYASFKSPGKRHHENYPPKLSISPQSRHIAVQRPKKIKIYEFSF